MSTTSSSAPPSSQLLGNDHQVGHKIVGGKEYGDVAGTTGKDDAFHGPTHFKTLHQIHQTSPIVQQLVGQRADLVVPGLGQVDREMQSGHDGELPAPAEAEVEGQRIQHAVDEQMIPVAPLRLRQVRGLEEVIPHQVTKNEFEDRFEHGHRPILPFPADFSIDREHDRTGLSCPGDRPWGGVTHARVYIIAQIYALFMRYLHAFRDHRPSFDKETAIADNQGLFADVQGRL